MKSEFTALLDLAVSKGISHTDLLSNIHSSVLEKFKESYPKSPSDAAVLVNESSGDVRIFSGDKDITPPDFAASASQIARQVIISQLSEGGKTVSGTSSEKVVISPPKSRAAVSVLGNLFFWGYNFYFLFFNLILVVSFFSNNLGTNFWESIKNLGVFRLLLTAIVLVAPLAAMVTAIKKRWYQKPSVLLQSFFLLELPIIAVCLLPLVLTTYTTPFVVLISLLALALPGIFYLYRSGVGLSLFWQKAVYFVQQYVFAMGTYLVFLFSFLVPLIIGGAAKSLLGDIFYRPSYSTGLDYYGMYPSPTPEPIFGLFVQLGIGLLILLLISGALLVPYLVLMVIWKALVRNRKALSNVVPRDLSVLDAVFAVVIITISLVVAYQPTNSKLLGPLKKLSQVTSFSEKEVIAKELSSYREKLKQLIVDQGRIGTRYFLYKDDTSLKYGYRDVFNMSDNLSEFIQTVFTTVAYPFVYQGESQDNYQLETNYQYLFGSSAYSTETKPAVPSSNGKNVLLTYRKVSVSPEAEGLVAAVTIEEEYENVTNDQQEVLYEFTLPRGAVMTDLRLGPDLEFTGIIAPKGAAQKTYERELQRRRDPALLEETGPRQYRLRVFPIPAKNDFSTLKGRRQKASFTYATVATSQGYPLPQVTRKTNVFTTAASQIFYKTDLGNKLLKDTDTYLSFPDNVLPDLCRGTGESFASNLQLTANRANLKNLACGTDSEVLSAISGAKIAVFYDVSVAENSFSQLDSLLKVLAKNKGLLSKNNFDLYKYNDLLSEKITLTGDNLDRDNLVVSFGKSDGLTALSEFNQRYDLVFIFGRPNLTVTETIPFAFPTRVFFVDSSAPSYNMKLASQVLQSGGDVADSFTEGVRLYLLDQQSDYDNYVLNRYFMVTGIELGPDQIPTPLSTDKTPLSQLVNQALFRFSLVRFTKDVSGDVAILDKLNDFSFKTNLVSPYSSLLALVNEQQEQTLEQLKQDYNRYQDQQLTQQQLTFPAIRNLQPLGSGFSMFGGLKSSGSMMGQGESVLNMRIPSISNPYLSDGAGVGGGSFDFGLSLFALAGLPLAVGLFIYLLRLFRLKSK